MLTVLVHKQDTLRITFTAWRSAFLFKITCRVLVTYYPVMKVLTMVGMNASSTWSDLGAKSDNAYYPYLVPVQA